MRRLPTVAVRLVTLFVTLFLLSRPAFAQRSWDFTAGTGGWWGRPDGADTAEPYDDEWFGTWTGSVSLGRYWTEHIKTEVDATFTSEGERYIVRQVQFPGERAPRFFTVNQQHQERSVAALMTLQAGRNWWVHPFLQGGVSVDWDEVRSEEFPPFITGSPPIGLPTSPETKTVARGIVAGGAKFYMTERAFFRADVRTSFGNGATHVQFRTGFGVDF